MFECVCEWVYVSVRGCNILGVCVRMSVFIKHRCHFAYILNGRLMQFNMEMTFYGILSHTITSISFLNNTNFRNLYCTWWRWYDHLTVIALFLLVGSEGGKRRWKRKAKHNNTIVMLHRWLIRMTVAYKASMSCFTNVMQDYHQLSCGFLYNITACTK